MEQLHQRLIPVAQAAKEKTCTRQTLLNAIDSGKVTGLKLGRYWFVVRDEKFDGFTVRITGGRRHRSYTQKRK